MDGRLGASFHTCHIIAHGVEAGLGGVDLDDVHQLILAALELVLPELA